jgi:hypothetical protein
VEGQTLKPEAAAFTITYTSRLVGVGIGRNLGEVYRATLP